MAVVNGRLPAALLTDIPGGRLDLLAADSWMRVRDEVHRRFGYVLAPTSYVDTYRPYEVQERIFRQRYTDQYVTGIDPRQWLGRTWWRKPIYAAAAVPGTSNHGMGVAIDVAYMGGFGSAKYAALSAVGPAHGWDNREGRSIAEPWHWRYRPENDRGRSSTPTAPPIEEDDMFTDADRARLGEIHDNAYRARRNAEETLAVVREAQETLVRIEDNAYRARRNAEETLRAVGGITSGAVDVDAIARAVNDDAARRLAE